MLVSSSWKSQICFLRRWKRNAPRKKSGASPSRVQSSVHTRLSTASNLQDQQPRHSVQPNRLRRNCPQIRSRKNSKHTLSRNNDTVRQLWGCKMISIFHVFFQRTSHLNFVCFFSLKIIDADLQSGVLAQPLCHSRSVSTSTVRLAQPLHGFNVEFFFLTSNLVP